MPELTAEYKIKRHILNKMISDYGIDRPKVGEDDTDLLLSSSAEIDSIWEIATTCRWPFDKFDIVEAEEEFRCSGEDTDLPCEVNPYYDASQVAVKLSCGAGVSWACYGYGSSSEEEWMEDAFEVDVTEEEKTVTVRTYTKKKMLEQ